MQNSTAISYLVCFLFLTSCKNTQRNITLPSEEYEFDKPSIQPFKFSEPKKINWIITYTDALKLPPPQKIDFNKIPAKPFYPSGFRPLNKPAREVAFRINSLPDTIFNYDELHRDSLHLQTTLLNPPIVIKARIPRLKEKAALGIFEFKEDQGLPGSLVSAIMRDSKGMLWIATNKGLCRLNGEYIETYSFVDRVFNGGFATINKLLEDDAGRIWCKTDLKGVYVLDYKAGLTLHFDIPGGFENFVTAVGDNEMIKDSRGLIWIGTSKNGLYIVDQQLKMIRHLLQMPKSGDTYTKEIVEDNEGRIWVGTYNGIHIIDQKTNSIHYLSQQQDVAANSISSLFKDNNGRIWIGSKAKGVDVINPENMTMIHVGEEQGVNDIVNNFTEDNKQRIWLTTNSSLYVLDSTLQKFRHLGIDEGLNENDIKCIAQDNTGQIWVGTSAGADLIYTVGIMPEHLNEIHGLTNSNIWGFVQDKQQRIWIGADKSIDVYDPSKNTIQKVFTGIQYIKLFKDSREQIWIGSNVDGIYLFDPVTSAFQLVKRLRTDENAIDIIEDHLGRVWTVGWPGITVFDQAHKQIKYFDFNDPTFENKAWALTEDHSGKVWIARDSTVQIIDPVKGTIRQLSEEKKFKYPTSSFLCDDDGRIWMGTYNGIRIADLKKQTITTFTTKEGLCAPDVYTLYKYKGKIYAGTGNGLSVFTPPDKISLSGDLTKWSARSYGKQQGLISRDFNGDAVIGVDNKLWWGVSSVMLTITDIPKDDSSVTSTYITGINVNEQPQYFIDKNLIQEHLPTDTLWGSTGDIFYLKNKLPVNGGHIQKNKITWDGVEGEYGLPVHLTLPYHQNHLTFYFAANHFSDFDKTAYRYILEGNDAEWNTTIDKAFADYRNLSPGRYTLKVCNHGSNGVWSKPAEFSFIILPPWWQTWWAYTLYAIAFGVAMWSFILYRSRNLRRQNLLLEDKVTRRTEQLNSKTIELNKSLQELKSTQAQLIQSEKMASLGELTAGVAHEIQNPLNFVNNFSEVNQEMVDELQSELKSGNVDEAIAISNDIKDNSEKINHHGKRADAIVKGMLQHSRTSTGVKEPTDINTLTDEYLRLAYHGMRAKDKSFNAEIKTDFDESIGKINIVSQDIGRVLLNLINNAFYAVNEKRIMNKDQYEPAVTVSTKKIGDKSDLIEISVTDNGNGIPESIKEKIFQPFFTTKPTGQGTGLGLSLSYDIIKAHNGEISVESKEKEATTFVIQLPIV